METINERINEAIVEIQTQICEVYGAPPDEEDAAEINEELFDFVKNVSEQAMEPVIETIRRTLVELRAVADQAEVGGNIVGGNIVGGNIVGGNPLARLEAKLDQLIRQQLPPANPIGPAPVPIGKRGNKSKRGNLWARYQKAWNKWRREEALEIPNHPGERSKLCSADYKNFNLKSIAEQDTFLSNYGA